MTQKSFTQYLEVRDFRSLFIEELGWNIADEPDIELEDIDGHNFTFEAVAQRNGLKALVALVKEIPNHSLCRRLDNKISRHAHDYIAIFCAEGMHQLWLVPVRTADKRDLVSVEYNTSQQTTFLFSKMQNLSFDIDEETTIVEVKQRVQEAFAVNSESVTKKFYTAFRQEHKAFALFISGIEVEDDKQWYASVMLNRLMFCYFIQKKGFLNFDYNYLQNKLKECKKRHGDNKFFSFYKGFLLQLFFGGLNSPKHNDDFELEYGKIPYLNGGMFDRHQLEQQYQDIDIKDEAFERLFAFFDKWEWHLDTRLTASGNDINPDVLGYIFEQYINDRAQMGAYYTKEDITEYIGRNTILPYLVESSAIGSPAFWKFLQQSGDRYVYDAVKKGHGKPIPDEIAIGLNTSKPGLLERRARWNDRTPETWALPTEIWRETIERMKRCDELLHKIEAGEITSINDFITYNLDIRQFVYDFLAKTHDHITVKHFYEALRRVSILDPTCGSGAFLFAALNILEPLYDICIERMEQFHHDNPRLFKEEIDELHGRYRSNRQYFIYKSIILRNLYGVDIMFEAVEIAKLRLFLKLVAVVDVNRHADNLGLDPLPDIDFNIRCGNTLVGYATEEELQRDLSFEKTIEEAESNQKFKESIEIEMQKVAMVYNRFKEIQLTTADDMDAFKTAKNELTERLNILNMMLNVKLFAATPHRNPDYSEWQKSHNPFHWLAEFYDIMHNGGFDIIIGNPPYVEYTRKNSKTGKSVADDYRIRNYVTEPCSNLYAFIIERSLIITKKRENIGFIVPLTIAANNNMTIVRNMICAQGQVFFSHFEIRPAKLFEGVEQRLTIFIIRNLAENQLWSTSIIRWHAEHRNLLFSSLHYAPSFNDGSIWRTSSIIESSIYKKIKSNKPAGSYISPIRNTSSQICYRTAGVRYWIVFLHNGFNTLSLSNKTNFFLSEEMSYYFMSAFNSNLFWWYYSLNYDMFNLKDYMIFSFRHTYNYDKELILLSQEMEKSLDDNKEILVMNSRTRGTVESFVYRKKYSKPIIDEIDKVLAKHYGFTEEELDFIINYDIKYRMGDEL